MNIESNFKDFVELMEYRSILDYSENHPPTKETIEKALEKMTDEERAAIIKITDISVIYTPFLSL